jgi:hypothetical protein
VGLEELVLAGQRHVGQELVGEEVLSQREKVGLVILPLEDVLLLHVGSGERDF